MAARFPILLVPSSRQFLSTPPHASFHLCSNPTRKRFTLCASAAKKPRASRKIMTDEELCNDIREFSSLHGLPRGQVPSMNELSTHGRKDLANIVRRRGYKLIGELLLKSLDIKAEEDTLDDQHLSPKIEIAEASTDGLLGQDENMHAEVGKAQLGSDVGYEKRQYMEKVSNFIQKGELDIFEDELQTLNKTVLKKEEFIKSESGTEISFYMHPEEDIENKSDGHNIFGQLNGRVPAITPSKALAEQDEFRDANLVPVEMSKSKQDLEVVMEGRDNQDEINNLKSELHQKELELFKLKEQIEKEKLALFHLQAKAEADISKALKLVAEKDTELSSVEEHLSGLKEVQIQYKGKGSTVEVAGSFNGWHHQIKMALQPSSTVHDSPESWKHRLWSVSLWLYPGVYEIKFIVDGHWTVDPHSESIMRGAIHNNILRVER